MSPVFEQLLFGSVDLVVDGRESSGWQVIEQTEGLDEAAADEIVRLIDPELSPLNALPGFPSQDEVRAADRRLVHRVVGGIPMLFHTAPAGLDTTGRPNTMTHVVMDRSDTTVRPLLGANSWRAEWWCTPFGPEQMRLAGLPSATALHPGTSVTADSALELVLRPGAAAVLGALADTVASNSDSTDPSQRRLALLLIEDVDDAAQWIGALFATTAAEPARRVSWSTLERVHGERDLEKLSSGGLDIAAVPAADLPEEMKIPEGCTVVDPRRPPQGPPATPFGRFVAAMSSDPGLWLSARESIQRDVLSQLVDHTGITFAWPLAMAQAMSWAAPAAPDLALFGRISDDELRVDTATVLLQATVPALDQEVPGTADALRNAREKMVDDVDRRGAAEWREVCRRVGDRVAEESALMLGRRYLARAVHDPAWLLAGRSAAPPLPEQIRAALQRWSTQEDGAAETADLVRAAIAVLDADAASERDAPTGTERSSAWGRLASELLHDGLVLDPGRLAALLEPLAAVLLAPSSAISGTDSQTLADVVAELPEPGREELARQLELGLAETAARSAQSAAPAIQPVLPVPVAIALGTAESAPQRPWLTLQAALAGAAAGLESSSAVLSALAALANAPDRPLATMRVDEHVARAVEALLVPDDLVRLEQLAKCGVAAVERWAFMVALRHPEHPESRRYLSARRTGAPTVTAVKRAPVTPASWEECALLLAEAVSRSFLTDPMTLASAWTWAENTHAAAAQMRRGLSQISEPPSVRSLLEELARTAALRAGAALVVLGVASPHLVQGRPRHALGLAEIVAEAAQDPRRVVASRGAPWGEVGIDALRVLAGGHGVPEAELSELSSLVDPHAVAVPGPAGMYSVAAAVLNARLRGAPDDAVPELIGEAKAAFRGDGPGWARAQKIVPMLEERRTSPVERLGDIVKKNLNILPWQKKEWRDG